jgi:hypothetical protein
MKEVRGEGEENARETVDGDVELSGETLVGSGGVHESGEGIVNVDGPKEVTVVGLESDPEVATPRAKGWRNAQSDIGAVPERFEGASSVDTSGPLSDTGVAPGTDTEGEQKSKESTDPQAALGVLTDVQTGGGPEVVAPVALDNHTLGSSS